MLLVSQPLPHIVAPSHAAVIVCTYFTTMAYTIKYCIGSLSTLFCLCYFIIPNEITGVSAELHVFNLDNKGVLLLGRERCFRRTGSLRVDVRLRAPITCKTQLQKEGDEAVVAMNTTTSNITLTSNATCGNASTNATSWFNATEMNNMYEIDAALLTQEMRKACSENTTRQSWGDVQRLMTALLLSACQKNSPLLLTDDNVSAVMQESGMLSDTDANNSTVRSAGIVWFRTYVQGQVIQEVNGNISTLTCYLDVPRVSRKQEPYIIHDVWSLPLRAPFASGRRDKRGSFEVLVFDNRVQTTVSAVGFHVQVAIQSDTATAFVLSDRSSHCVGSQPTVCTPNMLWKKEAPLCSRGLVTGDRYDVRACSLLVREAAGLPPGRPGSKYANMERSKVIALPTSSKGSPYSFFIVDVLRFPKARPHFQVHCARSRKVSAGTFKNSSKTGLFLLRLKRGCTASSTEWTLISGDVDRGVGRQYARLSPSIRKQIQGSSIGAALDASVSTNETSSPRASRLISVAGGNEVQQGSNTGVLTARDWAYLTTIFRSSERQEGHLGGLVLHFGTYEGLERAFVERTRQLRARKDEESVMWHTVSKSRPVHRSWYVWIAVAIFLTVAIGTTLACFQYRTMRSKPFRNVVDVSEIEDETSSITHATTQDETRVIRKTEMPTSAQPSFQTSDGGYANTVYFGCEEEECTFVKEA